MLKRRGHVGSWKSRPISSTPLQGEKAVTIIYKHRLVYNYGQSRYFETTLPNSINMDMKVRQWFGKEG